MRIKFLSLAFSIALSATVIKAGAQKTYTEGVITYVTNIRGQDVEVKEYFTTDSMATVFVTGPATIKILTDARHKSFETLVDVPAYSIQKAAIYTPDEVKETMATLPTFTFAPGTETKQISGFNCKKVTVTNTKDDSTYDVWITNDISVPAVAVPPYYEGIGGFPVQYSAFSQGQVSVITVSGVSDDKVRSGMFTIPPDFDIISKSDLDAMSGGH